MKKILWLVGGVVLILGITSYYMTYNKLNDAKNQALKEKQKIENKMNQVTNSEAADMNQKFLKHSFNMKMLTIEKRLLGSWRRIKQ